MLITRTGIKYVDENISWLTGGEVTLIDIKDINAIRLATATNLVKGCVMSGINTKVLLVMQDVKTFKNNVNDRIVKLLSEDGEIDMCKVLENKIGTMSILESPDSPNHIIPQVNSFMEKNCVVVMLVQNCDDKMFDILRTIAAAHTSTIIVYRLVDDVKHGTYKDLTNHITLDRYENIVGVNINNNKEFSIRSIGEDIYWYISNKGYEVYCTSEEE